MADSLRIPRSLWAFADDLAAILRQPSTQLPKLAALFRLARTATGLTLKPTKTVAVPLAPVVSRDLATDATSSAITAAAPAWTGVRVAFAATYLGVLVGPDATAEAQWAPARERYWACTCAIAAAGAASSVGMREYGRRALPCLGYVAQLLLPDATLARLDERARARLYRTPFRTIPAAIAGRPGTLAHADVVPAGVYAYATRFRAATTTATNVDDTTRRLAEARHRGGTLLSLSPRAQCVPEVGWRAPAFADALRAATAPGAWSAAALRVLAAEDTQRRGRQRRVARAVREVALGGVSEAVSSRLSWWGSHLGLGPSDVATMRANVGRLIASWSKARPAVALAGARTLLNGWTTSARTAGDTLSCRYGCVARDAVSHYVWCAPLWAAAEAERPVARPPTGVSRGGGRFFPPALRPGGPEHGVARGCV